MMAKGSLTMPHLACSRWKGAVEAFFCRMQVDPFLSTLKVFYTPKLSFPDSGDYIEVYRELGRELADVRVQVNFLMVFRN